MTGKNLFSMKNVVITIVILLFVIQFFSIDKTNPPVVEENDFITVANPPEDMAALIKTSCYDCHSYETRYPWYSSIAPVSWMIKSHISEGREYLNFSKWGDYPPEKHGYILGECYEEMSKGKMPLSIYVMMHSEARVGTEQLQIMENWLTLLKQPPVEKEAEEIGEEQH